MSRIPLTFACGDYDRTRSIAEGTVPVDGVDLNYLRLPVEETFFRMLRHREFEVAEMSLSTYTATLDRAGGLENSPFVAIPVYTSRVFRHGGIFINTEAGIERPSDLVGKRIAMPEMQLTAVVWQRGILADHYGVPLDSATYFTGGEETPGRIEKGKVDVPFDVRPIPEDKTISRMLADGELDALLAPRIPSTFDPKGGTVARLFPDAKAAEQEYFAQTGIFPIMHVVVIRRDVYERAPWVAQSLTKALNIAKKEAHARIYDASALQLMDPWLMVHLEQARTLMGEDFWSYGLGPSDRKVLETFLRYHHEQGLSRTLRAPEEIFAPEALESFVI
ncbi:ABC transporter substrate-binding protein [Microbacterium sp. MEC084]|uniref:ABC transporter substrate-binding protein n=1 Tax=Microbacterium sp. MEC084 TaxID=1963027 RepID=UPI00106F8EC0|nr:ABC transporter substrate-binding protein [Microbacterium sp. MEC084]MCD1269395.1 ABC transporter substrate-binding protein [Microbacterium sp. MEC084]